MTRQSGSDASITASASSVSWVLVSSTPWSRPTRPRMACSARPPRSSTSSRRVGVMGRRGRPARGGVAVVGPIAVPVGRAGTEPRASTGRWAARPRSAATPARRPWRRARHRAAGVSVKLLPVSTVLCTLISPPERAGQLAADREPQAGAAVGAAGGAVGLLEGLEDDRQLVLGDADAGVDHAEGDHVLGGALDAERDPALGGELERVGEQVAQDLLQALLVGDDRPRARRRRARRRA